MKQEIKTEEQQGAPDQKAEAHPSHYEPAKQDLKSERELRRDEARASSEDETKQQSGANGDATKAAHDSRRAQPPEDFTGLEISHASESAGGLPAIMSA